MKPAHVDEDGGRWFVLNINPEPWAVGPLDLGRRNGKVYATMGRNQELASYQEAVREEIGDDHEVITGNMQLWFYFWREQANYQSQNERSVRKHQADVTNMIKALEDALQGVLYENDRDTRIVQGCIVEQGPDVKGKVVIYVRPVTWSTPLVEFPEAVCRQLDNIEDGPAMKADNSWPPKGEGSAF